MPIFGMYKFIYPQMCPVYLTKEKLWDELLIVIYGDIMTYEIKCNEKYKNLRYKSEYTRNKKGEIINYSNTNT
jgi:hypothetical protein